MTDHSLTNEICETIYHYQRNMTDFKIDYNFLLDVSKGMREYYGVDKILFDFDELRDYRISCHSQM